MSFALACNKPATYLELPLQDIQFFNSGIYQPIKSRLGYRKLRVNCPLFFCFIPTTNTSYHGTIKAFLRHLRLGYSLLYSFLQFLCSPPDLSFGFDPGTPGYIDLSPLVQDLLCHDLSPVGHLNTTAIPFILVVFSNSFGNINRPSLSTASVFNYLRDHHYNGTTTTFSLFVKPVAWCVRETVDVLYSEDIVTLCRIFTIIQAYRFIYCRLR
ncbi:MAG: hypothetical protein EXX96DRAFT_610087 [Benjaminiella poitrasii]|nr:MAG: hypothetical protein EXX96DRAFT_610087 [Benjaminiella poitrasii]